MAKKREPSLFQLLKKDFSQVSGNLPRRRKLTVDDWKSASLLDQSSFLLIFLLVAVAAVAMIYRGNIERVKYLGVYPNVTYPNGMLLLETDPFGLWLIEPGETFNSLQAGCRYHFKSHTQCGGRTGCDRRNKVKWVYSAEFISCDARGSHYWETPRTRF